MSRVADCPCVRPVRPRDDRAALPPPGVAHGVDGSWVPRIILSSGDRHIRVGRFCPVPTFDVHGWPRAHALAGSAARERAALARGKHGGDGSAQARRQARRGVAGPPPTLPRMAYSERLRVLGGHITGASCSGTSEPAAQPTVGLLKCLLRPAIRLRFERSVSYWGRGLYAYHVLA